MFGTFYSRPAMCDMNQRPLSYTPFLLATLMLLLLSPAHAKNCRIGDELSSSLYESIDENLPVGSTVVVFPLVNTERLHFESNEREDDYLDFFALKFLNKTTGSIVVGKSLSNLLMRDNPVSVVDFQVTCNTNARDSTPYSLHVRIHIRDVNDNKPRFLRIPYIVSVSELTKPGTPIFHDIGAKDNDKADTPNSDVYMWIAEGNDNKTFDLLQTEKGKALLVLNKKLDFERGARNFELVVIASDRGSPQQQSRTLVKINVLDGDDQPPKFTAPIYHVNITEFPGPNMKRVRQNLDTIPQIEAFDGDLNIGQMIIYRLVESEYSNHFVLNRNTGLLTLVKSFDREQMKSENFSLYIEALQSNNFDRAARAEVKVKVIDLNDNKPEFITPYYAESIVENVPTGFKIFQVEAIDVDQSENAAFKFALSGDQRSLEAFEIDPNTGWISVKQQRLLDREQTESFFFQVQANEETANIISNNVTSAINVSIHLLDSNDNNPIFEPDSHYSFHVVGNKSVGQTIGQVFASDLDIGVNGVVRFSIDNNNHKQIANAFSIDEDSGQIRQELPLRNDIYVLFVRAEDSTDYTDQRRSSLATVTVNVTDQIEPYLSFISGQTLRVSTEVPPGTKVGHIAANSSNSNNLSFQLLNESVPFTINENTGELSVLSSLTKSSRIKYLLVIQVSNDALSTTGIVTVLLINGDDDDDDDVGGDGFTPLETISIPDRSLTVETEENKNNVELVNLLAINDFDNIELKDKKMATIFTITESGHLILSEPLDFEETQQLNLTIIGRKREGGQSRKFLFNLTVNVIDTNDNAPVFSRTIYKSRIESRAPIGSILRLDPPITVTDRDARGSLVDFRLINCTGYFSVNKTAILTKKIENVDSNTLYCKLQVFDEIGQISNTTLIINVFEKPIMVHQIVEDSKGNKWLDNQLISEMLDDKWYSVFKRIITNNSFYSDSLQPRSNEKFAVPYIRIPENFPEDEVVFKLASYHKLMKCQISELLQHNGIIRINQSGNRYFVLDTTKGSVIMARNNTMPNTIILQLSWIRNGERVVAKLIVDIVAVPRIYMSHSELRINLTKGHYYNLGIAQLLPNNLKDNETMVYNVLDDYDNSLTVSKTGQVVFSGNITNDPIDFTVKVCPGLCLELAEALNRTRSQALKVCRNNCARVQLFLHPINNKLITPESIIKPEFIHMSDKVWGTINDTTPADHKLYQYAVYKLVVPSLIPAGSKLIKLSAMKPSETPLQLQFRLKSTGDDTDTAGAFHLDPISGMLTAQKELTLLPGQLRRVVVECFDPEVPKAISKAVVEMISLGNYGIVGSNNSSNRDGEEGMVAVKFRLFRRSEYIASIEKELGEREYRTEVPWRDELLSLQTTWSVLQIKSHIGEPDIRVHINRNHTMSVNTDNQLEKDFEGMFLVTARQNSRAPRQKRTAGDAINSYLNQTMFDQAVLNGEPLENFLKYYQTILRIRIEKNRPPRFVDMESPVLVGVPYNAAIGYIVANFQASDENDAESLRYALRTNDTILTQLYKINQKTGQIKLMETMPISKQKIHYLEVEAVDKQGEEAAISVWVFVVDPENMAKVRMNGNQQELKPRINSISRHLSNITEYDVQVMDMTSNSVSSQEKPPQNTTDLRVCAFIYSERKLVDGTTLSRTLRDTNYNGTSSETVISGSWPVTANTSMAAFNLDYLAINLVALIIIIFVAVVIILCCKFSKRNKTSPKNGLTSSNSVFGSSTLSPPNSSSDMLFVGNPGKSGTLQSARHPHSTERQLDHVIEERQSNNNYTAFPSMSRKLKTNRISPNHYIADTTEGQNLNDISQADASRLVTFNSVHSPSVHYNRQTLLPPPGVQNSNYIQQPHKTATINRNNRNIFQHPLPPNRITVPPFDDQANFDNMKMSTTDGASNVFVNNQRLTQNRAFVNDFSYQNQAFSDSSSSEHKHGDQTAQIDEATMTFSSESPTFTDRPLMQNKPLNNSTTAF